MFAKITVIAIAILTALCAFLGLRAEHWESRYKQTHMQLSDVTEKYNANLTMLARYEKQASEFNQVLQRQKQESATRENQLHKALQNEKNKNWANDRVPSDVIGVYKPYFTGAATNAADLPANDRMRANAGSADTD